MLTVMTFVFVIDYIQINYRMAFFGLELLNRMDIRAFVLQSQVIVHQINLILFIKSLSSISYLLIILKLKSYKKPTNPMSSPQKSTLAAYNLAQKLIPHQTMPPSFGQVLTSSSATKGALESIDEFKGHRLIGISGGFKKIFMFEEVDDSENVVTALHPESQDFVSHGEETVVAIDEIVASLDGLKIVEICSGKLHNIIRTEEGHLFAYGKGQFGSLGLGGCVFSPRPRLISKLESKKIIAIACGAFHTLALSQIGDIYSWGRGFEGQLGIVQTKQKGPNVSYTPLEAASSPHYITHFFKYDNSKEFKMLRKRPIHKIACGAYHSLAIDDEGSVYTWGEAISGATGTGLKVKDARPVLLDISVNGEKRKNVKISGGFSHSMCLTDKGQIFAWGLNVKGQVGINDLSEGLKSSQNCLDYKKVVLKPTLLKQTRDCMPLPKFVDICCGFSTSFAIDEENSVWGWGGGNLGFKDKFNERGPTKLTQGTDNKKISKIFANEDSLILFAPFSPTYFKPTLAPSKGGTQMTFFGTGFSDTGNQSIIFKFGQNSQTVKLNFDPKTSTFYCKCISFDTDKNKINAPIECEISVTLDGKNYLSYEKKLLVYPQKLAIESIEPKSASAHGATQAKIYMPLHPLIQKYTQSITVGFKSNSKTETDTKIQDWVCVQGTYSEQNIHYKFPNIPFFNNDDPFYMVDVSLNGQEFTNHPQTVRFYLISETNITPNQGIQTEEPLITITGKGLFDTPFKQLSLTLNFTSQNQQYNCRKVVESTWLKNDRKFTFKMPTLKWILGDINVTEQLLTDARKNPLSVKLNLSKKDAIEVGKYKFVIPPPPEIPEEETNKKDGKKDTKKAAKK